MNDELQWVSADFVPLNTDGQLYVIKTGHKHFLKAKYNVQKKYFYDINTGEPLSEKHYVWARLPNVEE